jgi:hypothetical protein
LPIGLVLAYNLAIVGHVAGAYALVNPGSFVRGDVLAGVAGLLFSPTHGLFVYSPFLLAIPFCLPLVLRDRNTRPLIAAIGGAVVLQLILYGMIDWRQGASFGPRWLTDMLPLLFWMLPPVLAALPAAGRVAFGFACCLAVAIEVVGAFWYTGVADGIVMAAEGEDAMRAAWDIRNASFIAELKHPPVPADLWVDLRGSIDNARLRDEGGDSRKQQIEILGWALTNRRSPADVAVMVDGRSMGGTRDFFARPDVVSALGANSPSGWRITVPTPQLAAGKHTFAALVRAHEGGEPRLLMERTFDLAPGSEIGQRDQELAGAAHSAAKFLAERQQRAGYWLTAYTEETRFEQPRQEMNTYLNAVMIDLAEPIAEAAGMTGMLKRARDFLASQIEAGGLVRYHGRTDARTIGTLGCAITPDADDTALVWRIAPGERALLPMALATLSQFRRPDGLYRTWLSAQDRYECIDPGKDPNPADIAIQMHVLMLMAQADPPAARALCESLQRRSDDEDIWVYYKIAPIIPALRQTDLRKAGCALHLPSARLQTKVAGQEVWTEALALLQSMESADANHAAFAQSTELLHKFAGNNFSPLAQTPPLLYHNDMTASVPRFYWSEELGYVLWLRLYFATERVRSKLACRGDRPKHECDDK